jgi:hypothetical protein
VALAVGERLDADEVRTFCRARLATREAPELVVIGAAALPRNAVREVQGMVACADSAGLIA